MKKTKNPHTPKQRARATDQHVGSVIKARRVMIGMSQSELGHLLDVSFQQIQKYETGANRVSAGRLQQIAETLQIPIQEFFPGGSQAHAPGLETQDYRIAAAFAQIPDSAFKTELAQLIKVAAKL